MALALLREGTNEEKRREGGTYVPSQLEVRNGQKAVHNGFSPALADELFPARCWFGSTLKLKASRLAGQSDTHTHTHTHTHTPSQAAISVWQTAGS